MEETIKIKENGIEKEYDVIFSFESNNTNKKYVVYTDFSKDENNIINCYSNIYEKGKLLPIDTEAEINVIDEALRTIEESTNMKYGIKE